LWYDGFINEIHVRNKGLRMSNLVSAETAAGILELSRPTVTKLARTGQLPVLGFLDDRIAVFERTVIEAHKGKFAYMSRPRRRTAQNKAA
jgi:hypothetical protein